MSKLWQNRLVAVACVIGLGLLLLTLENRGKSADKDQLEEIQAVQEDQAATQAEQTATTLAQCISGNSSRLASFNDAQFMEGLYRELEGQEHDPEIAVIYHRAATHKVELQESYLSAARQRGELLDPHQPVISCDP